MARFTITAELAIEAATFEDVDRVKELVAAAISAEPGNVLWQPLPRSVKIVGLFVDREEG